MIRKIKLKQYEPIRYFRSDFLEHFTHTKLWHVWAVWGTIIFLSILNGVYSSGRNDIHMAKSLFFMFIFVPLGLVRWTLFEYTFHRILFHYDGPSEKGKKMAWYSHGTHHEQPMVPTRVVVPIIPALGIGTFILLCDAIVFGAIGKSMWMGWFFYAGTVIGYLIYDTIHCAVHVIDMDWPLFKTLRKNHMRHHRDHTTRFGISNFVWDKIFRTFPLEEDDTAKKQKEPAEEK